MYVYIGILYIAMYHAFVYPILKLKYTCVLNYTWLMHNQKKQSCEAHMQKAYGKLY